jgi:hypothetical protein
MTCQPIINDIGMRELELYTLVQRKQREYQSLDLDHFFKHVILGRLKEIKDFIKAAAIERGLFAEQIQKPSMDADTIRKLACYYVNMSLDIIRKDIELNESVIVSNNIKRNWRMIDFMAFIEHTAIQLFCESLYPSLRVLSSNSDFILYIMHCEVSNQTRALLAEHDVDEAARYLPLEFVANHITPYYQ